MWKFMRKSHHETDKISLSDIIHVVYKIFTNLFNLHFRVNIFEGILDYSSSQIDNQLVTFVTAGTADEFYYSFH